MNFFVFYYMIYLVLNNEEKGYIMKRKIPKITNSEKQILEVLWDEEKPLTSSEIVGVSDDRTWKASSVHLLLNSLLNKDLVEVAGFKKTTKNYARTFQPTMTREEYSINQLRQEQRNTSRTLSRLFHALLKDEEDDDLLKELADMVDSRRSQIRKDG